MVHEFGTPNLFLTLPHTVINVPKGYDMGKMCTENPISVSGSSCISFMPSSTIKNSGNSESNYMWKKEYQNCGVPHYHVLLWIQDASVVGADDPEKCLD